MGVLEPDVTFSEFALLQLNVIELYHMQMKSVFI